MNNDGSRQGSPSGRLSRRAVLKAAGGTGLAAGLAGCTAGGSETGDDTIQWYAGPNEAGAANELQQALYDAGLSEDISIEILPGPSDSSQKQQQLQRWLDAGLDKPDIIQMDSGWAIPFIARDQVLNLTESDRFPDSFVQRVENDYFESAVRTISDPDTGDLYGVPNFVDFATMLYRRDLVEQAGYDPEGQNWASESITWRQFSQVVSDVLSQNSDLDYGYTWQASSYEGLSCCDFNEFMSSWGGAYFGGLDTLFGPIGERPVTIDREAVINAIRMGRTFIEGPDGPESLDAFAGPISPRAVLSWIEDSSLAPFTNENAVAHRNWGYAIATAGAEESLGDRLGVMPLPYGVSQQQAQFQGLGGTTTALGGWHNTINPNSNNIDRAIEVLQAIATPEFALTEFELIGILPPQPAVLDSQEARQVPVVGEYVEQLLVAGQNAVSRPVTVVWPQESTRIAQTVNNAIGGGISPEQAAASLQQNIMEIENFNREDGN
jgi:ABC-type glycerol-3-phosphate transport system substrate-binding protein